MLTSLTEDWKSMSSKLNYPINFFPQDMELHTSKNKCNLCNCKFNKTAHKKTKSHYHYLKENNYAGTLCTMCNLKPRTHIFLPVVFHNHSYNLSLMLDNYDEDKFSFNVNKKKDCIFILLLLGSSNYSTHAKKCSRAVFQI